MTVLNYMANLRERVAKKHLGETYLFGAGEAVEVPQHTTYDILCELDGIQGLNVKERLYGREETTV